MNVAYLGYDEISIVKRGIVEMDQDIMITQLWELSILMELETVKAIFAGNSPLFGGCWHHCHCQYLIWEREKGWRLEDGSAGSTGSQGGSGCKHGWSQNEIEIKSLLPLGRTIDPGMTTNCSYY